MVMDAAPLQSKITNWGKVTREGVINFRLYSGEGGAY